MNITLHSPWASLRSTFPIRKGEWLMAVAVLFCWVIFTFNDDLFASSASYEKLARFAPQHIWAWICFFLGAGRFAVLFINGSYWRTPHARAACAFLSCFLWFQLFAGLSPNGAFGAMWTTIFLVLDALNFRQAMSEAAISEAVGRVEREHRVGHTD